MHATSRVYETAIYFPKARCLADATSIATARSISDCDWSFVQAAGYALRFIIMKIVCEVDYLEDNEPIIYGPYA